MYVIPLLCRLCAALPDKSNLLTLVAGFCYYCALLFVKIMSEKGKRVRESPRKKK